MIENHPEGQQPSINYHLSTIIYQLSFIIYQLSFTNYYEERTLAENHSLRHNHPYGDSDHPGNYLVHQLVVTKGHKKRSYSLRNSFFSYYYQTNISCVEQLNS